ncbi:thioredoxin-like protein [Chiua virens]|nr:thioredoxin-like protein [Chiua virens]
MAVTTIESLSQFKEIIAGDEVALIDFYADWCGPCKMISPLFAKSAEEYQQVKFYKVDIDKVPDVAEEVGVRSIPLFHAWKNDKKIGELLGANVGALKDLVQKGVSLA